MPNECWIGERGGFSYNANVNVNANANASGRIPGASDK